MVDLAIKPAPDENRTTATAFQIQNFGLSAYSYPDLSSGLSFGYTELKLVAVPDNFCLDLDQIGFCDERKQPLPSLLKENPR